MTTLSVTRSEKRLTLDIGDGRKTVSVQRTTASVITAAIQGAPGRDGVYGGACAAAYQVEAGENLGGHRVVKIAADGLAYYASNLDTDSLHSSIGVTNGAASEGATVDVIYAGTMDEPSWAFVPNMPVFLSENGLLTQTPPTLGFIRVMGVPLSPTRLIVRIQQPISI